MESLAKLSGKNKKVLPRIEPTKSHPPNLIYCFKHVEDTTSKILHEFDFTQAVYWFHVPAVVTVPSGSRRLSQIKSECFSN